MSDKIQFKSALISVYHKEGLEEVAKALHGLGVEIWSTGGTWDFLNALGCRPRKVEDLTGYPSILGGRVKTLHPKVFGAYCTVRTLWKTSTNWLPTRFRP